MSAGEPFTYRGRQYPRCGGDCSCCGADETAGYSTVYRAGLCDADGVYFARLCDSCLFDVAREQTGTEAQMLAGALVHLMPGELDDGVPSMLADYMEEVA